MSLITVLNQPDLECVHWSRPTVTLKYP